jgi:hypothetical protein
MAASVQLGQSLYRREVINLGSWVHKVKWRSEIDLRQQTVRQATDIGNLQGEVMPELAAYREIKCVGVRASSACYPFPNKLRTNPYRRSSHWERSAGRFQLEQERAEYWAGCSDLVLGCY